MNNDRALRARTAGRSHPALHRLRSAYLAGQGLALSLDELEGILAKFGDLESALDGAIATLRCCYDVAAGAIGSRRFSFGGGEGAYDMVSLMDEAFRFARGALLARDPRKLDAPPAPAPKLTIDGVDLYPCFRRFGESFVERDMTTEHMESLVRALVGSQPDAQQTESL